MQQQYDRDTETITIYVDGNELRTMEDNEMAVWYTPGSSQVYVASQASFRDDTVVATTSDLLAALGYDFSDGLNDDDIAEYVFSIQALND